MKRARTQDAAIDYSQDCCVEVNVGGRIYTFNAQSLHRAPPGLLANMFGPAAARFGGVSCRDAAGRPYIEWDGDDFGVVASVLRSRGAAIGARDEYESARETLAYFFEQAPAPVTPGMRHLSTTQLARLLSTVCSSIRGFMAQNASVIARARPRRARAFCVELDEMVGAHRDLGMIVSMHCSSATAPVSDEKGPRLRGASVSFVLSTVYGVTETQIPHEQGQGDHGEPSARAPPADEATRICQELVRTLLDARGAYTYDDVRRWLAIESGASEARVHITHRGEVSSTKRDVVDFNLLYLADDIASIVAEAK